MNTPNSDATSTASGETARARKFSSIAGGGGGSSGRALTARFLIALLFISLAIVVPYAIHIYQHIRAQRQADADYLLERAMTYQAYGVHVRFDDDRKIAYTLKQKADVPKKLQTQLEFDIKPGPFSVQLGDLFWLIDVPAVAVFYGREFDTQRPAFAGKLSAGDALDTFLKSAGCANEVVSNEVLLVYCRDRYTLYPSMKLEQSKLYSKVEDEYEPQIRPLGDSYCARQLIDACVNGKSKHIFVPKGDAAQTLLAFKRIQTQGMAPLPFDLLIPKDAAGHQTQEINGVLSATEALNQMLKGSGLELREGPGWGLIVPTDQLTARGQSSCRGLENP